MRGPLRLTNAGRDGRDTTAMYGCGPHLKKKKRRRGACDAPLSATIPMTKERTAVFMHSGVLPRKYMPLQVDKGTGARTAHPPFAATSPKRCGMLFSVVVPMHGDGDAYDALCSLVDSPSPTTLDTSKSPTERASVEKYP